jgi:hypothetical protein
MLLKSARSADLLSFSGVTDRRAPSLLCCLLAYDRAKMQWVYLLIVVLTNILVLFVENK